MLRYFRLTIHAWSIGHIDIMIHCDDALRYHVEFQGREFDGTVNERTATVFKTKLTLLKLEKWKDEYHPDHTILDGESWEVEYEYEGHGRRTIIGDNAFPDNWRDLIELLDDLIEELELVEPERIDYLELEYDHKLELEGNGIVNYSELLTIDRKCHTLIYTKIFSPDCTITHQYESRNSLENLLDDLKNLLPAMRSDEVGEYEESLHVNITRRNKTTETYVLPYDRRHMSDRWQVVMGKIEDYMKVFGLFGSLFAKGIYGHGVARGEVIYASVAFCDYGQSYYYITEDDELRVGDHVVVPAGVENKEQVGTIVEIDYYTKEKVPYPYENCKRIIRKA